MAALCLDDFTGPQAARADAHALARAVHNGPDRPQIHVPATPAHIVGVADRVSKLRAFAANFTYSGHDRFSRK